MDQRAIEKVIELMIVLCEIEESVQDIGCRVNTSKSDGMIDE